MLKKIRILLAAASFLALTWLFVDVSGVAQHWVGWLAKMQVVPALLALNVVAIVVLALLTLVFGRIYCSVLCPLGVFQDIVIALRGKVGRKSKRKMRFGFRPELKIIRYSFFALMVVLMVAGLMFMASLLDPYSQWGRIAQWLISPAYDAANNALADVAAAHDSYLFSHVEPVHLAWQFIVIAAVSAVFVGVMAWTSGRLYCNSVCPVGTLLGLLGRVSLLKPVIDTSRCNGCKKCARKCKASCINPDSHTIDYSRCVVCMDCIENCSTHAIRFTRRRAENAGAKEAADDRRAFLAAGLVVAGAAVAKAAEKTTDGGLAPLIPKEPARRSARIVPPGAISVKNLTAKCTSCQLCIASCPNGVLRPSMDADTFMQPVVGYEDGYCRPECTSCSDVCPAGAIVRLEDGAKSAVSVGHAVVDLRLCLEAGGRHCGSCSSHCPVNAIEMIAIKEGGRGRMPVVNDSVCVGCGACEHLCPVNPLSAIHVEGYNVHRKV